MITLIVAAAAVAQAPASTAPAPAQPAPMMQMGDHPAGQHAMKEKCCCDDMAKDEGHAAQHSGHPAR
jgi:hypothetical protein